MRVRALDESGDIATRGAIFISGSQAVQQTIVTRLRLFLGEYHLDVRDGTPWFQSILGKYENLNAVESILRMRIRRTEGVIELLSFRTDFDLESRSLNVFCVVQTEYGNVEVNYYG